MTARRDPDRMIRAFLMDGQTELADPVFDAVRSTIEQRQQRVVIGPWRMPLMNKFVSIGLGAAAVVALLVIGIQLLGPAASSGVGGPGATPSPTPSPTPVGGTVQYHMDGDAATTEVKAVTDGALVSGTAVTTRGTDTHTVQLECAAVDGDAWILAGTIEKTTFAGEVAGGWSAVIVKDGTPQQVGIWFSEDKVAGVDCGGWVATIDTATIPAQMFQPVESGALMPPPVPST